jgi:hypothetical protein
MISGDRMEKRPLTHQPKSFAVWHRLLQNLLASPRGPFMVELFTAGGFAAGLRAGLAPGFNCHQLKAPHASQVERSQRLRAPWTGLRAAFQLHITRFEHCGLQSNPDCRYVRIAPIFLTGGRNARLVRFWSTSLQSVESRSKVFQSSDRVSGLLCVRCDCHTRAARGANTGLLRQASVELDEPVSWHPALRADHLMVG